IETEFVDAARARGHSESLITEVWELVTGFNGYAFCRAHSTAYGVEAYQSAWLKLNFPAEFMASVLTHGKGFYSPLAYILECHRLGIRISPPWINAPGPAFQAIRQPGDPPLIRIPALRVKHLGEITSQRILSELQRNHFSSLQDFYLRTQASQEEMESLLRSGAFDGFGKPRTTLFWEWQQARRAFGGDLEPGQGWLLPPPDLDKLPEATLSEPSHLQRLEWEMDLFGFTASGHPLELYPAIAWNTYCPIHRLGEFLGEEVVVCGLVIEQRTHHQVTGELMKFMTICDWTGIVETELFADSYRSYGQETSRHKVLELHARVESFDNHCGHTLRILKARRPREQMS
ncbi:MAG: fused DNA polymerase IV/DNA polymerase III subunit alpha, partial [Verrucomicrobia bacterium]|nr:fused DNA polymerase IV/DNA polymerase III subunit alpha [Verrucomicrobiota bacterium]